MVTVTVLVPGTNAGVTPPGCIPGSVMLAVEVKDSVPSTMRSSNPSMTTVMVLRWLAPISNVTSFVMKQKSPLNGGEGSGIVFGQSGAPLEKGKERNEQTNKQTSKNKKAVLYSSGLLCSTYVIYQ